MTISLWRYAHLALALVISTFVLIASVTGIILAVEPISNQLKPIKSPDFEETELTETLIALKEKYAEIIAIEINHHHHVLAEVIDNEGNNIKFYINPKTAERIGDTFKRPQIFHFSTTLHRSLFLGKAGRIIMSIVSFLLIFIVITGIFLIIRRQQKWKRFFCKINKDSFAAYYHTVLGRWMLFPIIIIAITGFYLSLDKLSLLPQIKVAHHVDWDTLTENPKIAINDIEAFKVPISQVEKIEFPFSDQVDDYYTLHLIGEEKLINQFTGQVLSHFQYPLTHKILHYSFGLHTGAGSIIWSVVLFLACVSLLFFIYSGFSITLKRKKSGIKNKFHKNNCTHIILVGSEGGTTLVFANLLYNALLRKGKKTFVAEMNAFSYYPEMTHLIVMTSTYGQGDAPSNATKFVRLYEKATIEKPFSYSVVGFGSLAYPDFCKFAFDVDALLEEKHSAKRFLQIETINNQSFEAFSRWVNHWATLNDMSLILPKSFHFVKIRKQQEFRIINKELSQEDETFLITLKTLKKQRFQSGDLLGIVADDGRERLYSIAKMNETELLLSVKIHDKGMVSNMLLNIQQNVIIKASIKKNVGFHFPRNANKVVFIATGTGIAPFLGMMNVYENQTQKYLFWGGKTQKSFDIYRSIIARKQSERKMGELYLALSQVKEGRYVQDLIEERADFFVDVLSNKGVIMVCGSVAMQKGVVQALEVLCQEYLYKPLSYYQNKGQLLMDCY